jgi:ankyrin repeat protein
MIRPFSMIRPNWQWLLKAPLTPAWRRRLELCLGVVMSGAVVVAMSTAIRPDPAKLAAKLPVLQSSPPTAEELEMARLHITPGPPAVPQAFRDAVREGDVASMRKYYLRGMPIEGFLSDAAKTGKRPAVDWLLDHGADIHESESYSYAPVLMADAYPELVAYLRSRGAAEPGLEAAAEALAPHAVERLLAKHPNVNDRHSFPLGAAAGAPATDPGAPGVKLWIIQRLLDAGADPNHVGVNDGTRPALAAAITSIGDGEGESTHASKAIVRLLLDKGAKVTGDALAAALNLDDDATRATVLDWLFEGTFDKGDVAHALAHAARLEASDVKRLIQHGGVDWAWHDGEDDAALPLLEAVRRGDRDAVRVLLDAGAPVDVHFKDGVGTLGAAIDGVATDSSQARVVELLVTRGANVNRRLPDGRTPLFAAAEAGDLRTVNFLLERGARVNDRVLDDTALDAAEQNGHTPIARVLHAHGGQRAPKPVYPSTWGGL